MGALYPDPLGLHPMHLHAEFQVYSQFSQEANPTLPLWSQFAPDSGLAVGGKKIKALDARICHGLGLRRKPGLPRKGEE